MQTKLNKIQGLSREERKERGKKKTQESHTKKRIDKYD